MPKSPPLDDFKISLVHPVHSATHCDICIHQSPQYIRLPLDVEAFISELGLFAIPTANNYLECSTLDPTATTPVIACSAIDVGSTTDLRPDLLPFTPDG